MEYRKKGVYLLILALILLIPFTYAEQVVQVQQTPAPAKTGFFSAFGFLKSPIFWYIVIAFVILIAILVGLFFLVRWLITFLKIRNDIFWKLRDERIKLAKIQRRYPSKHFYKVHKNIPIRLVRKDANGHSSITSPVAYHRGDYVSHEGNVVICMNLAGNKKWWFIPITDLLIVPDREKVEIITRDEKGKEQKIEIANIPRAKDIVQFNENEILIYAESFSNVGQFYVPVLKASDGKIIDLSLPTYQSLKEVVLGDFLYEQTDEFSKLAKKSMDINPNLRYQTKSSDTSQSVEVPQSTK